jgi:hypothetical protein
MKKEQTFPLKIGSKKIRNKKIAILEEGKKTINLTNLKLKHDRNNSNLKKNYLQSSL